MKKSPFGTDLIKGTNVDVETRKKEERRRDSHVQNAQQTED